MRRWIIAAFICAAFVGSRPASAATQIVNESGILTGASGVIVDGASYDVSFVEGELVYLYFDQAHPRFVFSSQQQAVLAAQSLIDQVFVDTPLGQFDSESSKTFGCQDDALACISIIASSNFVPYGGFVGMSVNSSSGFAFGDRALDSFWEFGDGTIEFPGYNFAVFTPSAQAVPEPDTWLLMIGGFALAGMAMRRRRGVSHLI